MARTFISIKTSFEALHCWPECPIEEVSFLKNPHRHIFHVKVVMETFEDRQIEFIDQKRKIEDFIEKYKGKNLGSMSCEKIAEEIAEKFRAKKVEVEEDGENGAIYIRQI